MPRLQSEWPSESLHGLDLDLRLSTVLQLLVKLEFEARHFRHLFLGEVDAQTKLPEILGEMRSGIHRSCYQSYRLAYHRTIVLPFERI